MKRTIAIVTVIMTLAVMAMAQGARQPGQAAASHQKTITNPAEYNAYLGAIQQSEPKAKALALEGFLQQYPNSVVREDALQLLMATYQQMGNTQKVMETANRLLQVDPNNLRALALLAFVKRQQAEAGGPQATEALNQAEHYAQRGLQALQAAKKPEGMPEAEFEKLKNETRLIFDGVAGNAALQNKNYAQAQQLLSRAVTANPKNLADVYALALSYLQAQPPDYINGLWYMARAADLASQNPAAKKQINETGLFYYNKYHGSTEGWDQVLQTAATATSRPPGFNIQPAPSPAEKAARLAESKPAAQMDFDDFQTILTSGNSQAAERVWSQIKDKPIAFEAKVVEATPTKLTLAASGADIAKRIPDVTLTMAEPIPAKLMPRVGSTARVQGTPVSYSTQPYMITMTKGGFYNPPKAPGRSSAGRRRGL